MLLIGGFTVSATLSQTSIDRVIVTRVLSLAGNRGVVLLVFGSGELTPPSARILLC